MLTHIILPFQRSPNSVWLGHGHQGVQWWHKWNCPLSQLNTPKWILLCSLSCFIYVYVYVSGWRWRWGVGIGGWLGGLGVIEGGEGYVQSTEARVALGCELLDMDAGIWILVFWKSCECWQSLSCLSSSRGPHKTENFCTPKGISQIKKKPTKWDKVFARDMYLIED